MSSAAPRTFASLRARPRQESPDDALTAGCAHRIFNTTEGQIILAWLHYAVDPPLSPDASDGALRMREGERMLLRRIEGLIARGEATSRRDEGPGDSH